MLHNLERLLLVLGVGLSIFYVSARMHAYVLSYVALSEFSEAHADPIQGNSAGSGEVANQHPNFRLWGEARIRAYQASLGLRYDPPIGVLSISRIGLTAPVFEGTDEITLNRGLGRVEGTDKPGGTGNVAIAGHRDGFFRALKNIRKDDLIEFDSRQEKDFYSVQSIEIVDPKNVAVLAPGTVPTITLITCYPFYFIGDAPQRLVVKALMLRRERGA